MIRRDSGQQTNKHLRLWPCLTYKSLYAVRPFFAIPFDLQTQDSIHITAKLPLQ
jgi:hypothetical protein